MNIPPPLKPTAVEDQISINNGFKIKQIPGRGRGIIATRDFEVAEQIMFVNKPSSLCIVPKRLSDTCYHCLRHVDSPPQSSLKCTCTGTDSLKNCSGCRTVKYCSDACQKLSWEAHHKYECRIFRCVQPIDTNLPSGFWEPRSAIRILLLRKKKRISESEWNELLQLAAHVDENLAEEARGTQLRQMSQQLHQLLKCGESIETICRLLCVCNTNAFGANFLYGTLIASVLHPLPSMINHSCDPNAHIRTDVSKIYSDKILPNPLLGSISVHARRKISKGDEILITYVPGLQTKSQRQQTLRHNHFFVCSCSLCTEPEAASSTKNARKSAITFANEVSSEWREEPTYRSTDSVLKRKVQFTLDRRVTAVPVMELALTALARQGVPIDHESRWFVRRAAAMLMDELSQFDSRVFTKSADGVPLMEAVALQYLILIYRIYNKSEPGQRWSYFERLKFQWNLHTCLCWLTKVECPDSMRKIPLSYAADLRMYVLEDIAQAVLTREQRGIEPSAKEQKKQKMRKKPAGDPMQGLFEMMVLERYQPVLKTFSDDMRKFREPNSHFNVHQRHVIRALTDKALAQEQTFNGRIPDGDEMSKQSKKPERGTAGLEMAVSEALDQLCLHASVEESLSGVTMNLADLNN